MKLTEPLDVTFKAKVRQDTGLDWKGVKLSLLMQDLPEVMLRR